MIQNNPNATVAAVAGAITVILVWIVGLFNVDIPPEVSSAITTVGIAVILFVGKHGKQAVAGNRQT